MRRTLVLQTITDELTEARALLEREAIFSAAVRLGVLESTSVLLTEQRSAWLREQIHELIAGVDIDSLVKQCMDKADRLRRALTHGVRYESEELVFALTLRIEIAAALHCAASDARGSSLNVNLSDCDEALVEIANSSTNRNAYQKAISLIEKNWRSRIPFMPGSLGIPTAVGLIDS